MLDFFRKYQRYFFLVITVVIIISFSFFGTYSTLGSNKWREQIAFKAVNGQEVTRSDLDEMVLFLSTDNEDKQLYGGAWGPNFLNDGVIRKDILETGLGEELALAYQEELQEDIDKRLAKEKKYKPYSHPQVGFLGVENVWRYFAPEINKNFQALRASQNGLDSKAFNNRVQLYLAQRQLPPSMVRYVLHNQEKMYDFIKPDENLDRTDLSLFGYHTIDDWFGPHFTRLISQFIINAAILAEAQGYDVSKGEVLADMVRNTQLSYQQNINNPNLGVTTPEEYLSEQLRRLNMDQVRAIKVWRQILLFRRYFHDAGAVALLDNMATGQINQFAHENVTVDLYRLPSSLKLANYNDLQQFEAYLYAVGKQNKADPLGLPEQFLAVADVSKNYPELVKKQYELEVAKVSQNQLQARIGVRELWNWEVEDSNWELLVKQFPTLGVKSAKTREERFEALDDLDSTTRSIVNAFARQSIVKAHPEWIDQALSEANSEKMLVGIRSEGGKMPFSGLDDKEERQAFIKLLDKAPLGEKAAHDSPLYAFTGDHQTYYRIGVINREEKAEILTFAEAKEDGTLNDVTDHILEKYYLTVREKSPSLYQNENKEWKSFDSARDLVANKFFEKVLTGLEEEQKKGSPDQEKKSLSKDKLASLRFNGHLNKIKEALKKDPSKAAQFIKTEAPSSEDPLSPTPAAPLLADQWKIEKSTLSFNRQKREAAINPEEAFTLKVEEWSSLQNPPNGDLSFYQVQEHRKETEEERSMIAEQIRDAQFLLGAEAQRHLMRQVLQELKSKNALSLAYLKLPVEEPSSQEQETMEAGY